ncbi:MAG: protease modulator HflC [Synergistaceae bacterium]|nr:protease modulator HflC [Synergistaceae bacterium]
MGKLILKLSLVALGAVALLLLPGAFYVVGQNEHAALIQFGRIIHITDEPGLKLKLPVIQSARHISKRLHLYDIPSSSVITKDKKSMIADDYVLWRVVDPTRYIQTLDAIEPRAQERIEAAVYNATKNAISSMSQDEVIEARGEMLSNIITEGANSDMGVYGIVIVQAQIKALDLPNDNKAAVYERMISERQNIAASYAAEGRSEAQKIRNQTDRDVAIVLAEAQRQAAVTVAEGEVEYMRTLKAAYDTEEKAAFYTWLRALDALRESFSSGDKTLILDRSSPLVKALYGE